jgi:hypothetical protein
LSANGKTAGSEQRDNYECTRTHPVTEIGSE